MIDRRSLLGFFCATCLTDLTQQAQAQAPDWPQRNPTFIVPLAAGGSTDTTARLVAEKLGAELGRQIVVENRPGAGGNLGAGAVAKAKPDGYTLLLGTSTLATNATLYRNMGFDLRKDLVGITQLTRIPNVLVVNNNVPSKTLAEFIAYARGNAVNFGSAGSGTSQHLAGALFNSLAKVNMVHVPYRGGAPANTDLLAGQIQAVFAPLVEILPYIEAGQLRALGVTTTERSLRLPDVPAISELLPGFEIVLWNGLFAPSHTPPSIIDQIAAKARKVMENPSVRKLLTDQGTTPVGSTPAEFQALLEPEIRKWGKLVELSGAKVD